MAINLATKYSNKIAEAYAHESYIANAYVSNAYDFAGVRSVTIYTPTTVEPTDYNRSASANRFGTPEEMQDVIQELTMSQDKSFALTIDKGNQSDQMQIKEAGRMMKLQVREKVTPMMDKYSFAQWMTNAGTRKTMSAPTKTTVVGALYDGLTAMDNAQVAENDRVIYIGATYYNLLRQSTEFLAVDPLAEKALTKGLVGSFGNCKVVKVPDAYLTGGFFLITQKEAVLRPIKIKTSRILTDAPGIDGSLLEGRYYYDAFVLDTKKLGVYAAVNA